MSANHTCSCLENPPKKTKNSNLLTSTKPRDKAINQPGFSRRHFHENASGVTAPCQQALEFFFSP